MCMHREVEACWGGGGGASYIGEAYLSDLDAFRVNIAEMAEMCAVDVRKQEAVRDVTFNSCLGTTLDEIVGVCISALIAQTRLRLR